MTPRESAVLDVLRAERGRVVGRAEIARRAGLAGLSERRVDALVAAVRRKLASGTVVTVRGRGWMFEGDG